MSWKFGPFHVQHQYLTFVYDISVYSLLASCHTLIDHLRHKNAYNPRYSFKKTGIRSEYSSISKYSTRLGYCKTSLRNQ